MQQGKTLAVWLAEAAPGECFEYHRGRHTNGNKIASLAAWSAMMMGKVALTQKRHGAFDYSYLATKRHVIKPTVWRGCYEPIRHRDREKALAA